MTTQKYNLKIASNKKYKDYMKLVWKNKYLFDFYFEYPDVIPKAYADFYEKASNCLLYTSPSPRDRQKSRMPSSA